MEEEFSNPATGWLSVATVDVCTGRWEATRAWRNDSALHRGKIRPSDVAPSAAAVAKEILERPADFVQAAENHCEPELKLCSGNATAQAHLTPQRGRYQS